jgi:hypothetical protein
VEGPLSRLRVLARSCVRITHRLTTSSPAPTGAGREGRRSLDPAFADLPQGGVSLPWRPEKPQPLGGKLGLFHVQPRSSCQSGEGGRFAPRSPKDRDRRRAARRKHPLPPVSRARALPSWRRYARTSAGRSRCRCSPPGDGPWPPGRGIRRRCRGLPCTGLRPTFRIRGGDPPLAATFLCASGSTTVSLSLDACGKIR